jgi:Fe-S cluster assembly iron-binding protein IscA
MLRRSCFAFRLSASVAQHSNAVKFSDRAWSRVVAVNANENADSQRALRMSIVPGGCQGFSYQFEFDTEIDPEEDIVFENDSVPLPPKINENGDEVTVDGTINSRIVIDQESLKKLQGSTIDYHSELKGSAFVVVGNELVDQACACAASFSLQK